MTNIERPVRVTHLLCAAGTDETSEKVMYARKFNKRKEADIRVVWEQWFWDSFRVQGPSFPVGNPTSLILFRAL